MQARQGQYAPFSSYLQQYQLRHALTPSQVADWLQVALWAGQDDEVVKVWRLRQVYMPIPAQGTAAAAQALRNQKQWQTSLTLWQQALSRPGSDDYRIGYIKTLADARKDGEALSERTSPGGGAGERCAPADASPMSTCGWAKAGTSCWWTRRSSIVNRKTKLRWPA